jgi:hypothetical protein
VQRQHTQQPTGDDHDVACASAAACGGDPGKHSIRSAESFNSTGERYTQRPLLALTLRRQ